MILYNFLNNWFFPIIQSVIAAYIFLVIVKCMVYWRIKRFEADYIHDGTDPVAAQITFHVTCSWYQIFIPILNISIRVRRTGDQGDWESKLYSDILNIYHFKGPYKVKKPEGGKDGWFDAYLFEKPVTKIALHLHYIKGDRWIENEGYIIEKSNQLVSLNRHSSI